MAWGFGGTKSEQRERAVPPRTYQSVLGSGRLEALGKDARQVLDLEERP
jgi:hypothetical protein